MTRTKVFCFDARSCSGCKACVAACRDKKGHDRSTRLRRVYEIAGGGWVQDGKTWRQDVFAYHVSMSCNHCGKPICVEVCPSRAMRVGQWGNVVVDDSLCLGCGYCAFACPYGAPVLDLALGVMTKCDLCADLLAEGRSPACTTACPMRALELCEAESLPTGFDNREVFPLPPAQLTDPHWFVAPHPDSQRATQETAIIAHRKGVRSR